MRLEFSNLAKMSTMLGDGPDRGLDGERSSARRFRNTNPNQRRIPTKKSYGVNYMRELQ